MPTSRLAVAFSLALVACTAEGVAPASDAGTRKELPGATCGDGVAEFGEVCDGDDVSCAELELPDGVATCYADCSGYNTDACLGPDVCGNRLLEDGERCDDGLEPRTECLYGIEICTLCDDTCTPYAGTGPYCGDGRVNGPLGREECDGNDFIALLCEDFLGENFEGVLSCAEGCVLDTSACTAIEVPGPDVIEEDVEEDAAEDASTERDAVSADGSGDATPDASAASDATAPDAERGRDAGAETTPEEGEAANSGCATSGANGSPAAALLALLGALLATRSRTMRRG